MKIHFKPFAAALLLAGIAVAPVMAATPAQNADIAQDKTARALQLQLAQLQKQVNSLQQQVNSAPVHKKQPSRTASRHYASNTRTTSASAASSTLPNDGDSEQTRLTGKQLVQLMNEEREYLPFDLDVPGQAFVSTGPYVGVPIQYAGSDLVVNTPSVNTDLQLLGIRKNIMRQLRAMHGEIFKEPYHSHLLLSGLVEGQAGYFNPGGRPSTSYIDVTNVSLDAFFIGPSDWTLGFIEFTYDGGKAPGNNNYVVSNSRVFINKAFITIGDLERSPIYGTLGQFYVPFGTYASVMVSETLPKILGRTKARALEVGFSTQDKNSFFGSAYIFRGDSHAASVSKINNGGINLGYKFDLGKFRGTVGGGVIASLTDSAGMQLGNGFSAYEQIHHRVPGYDVRALFSFFDHFDLIAEYVTASTSFNPNDMSYNGHGAKPSALDTELAYSFYLGDDMPSSVAIGYGKSNQAMSLGMPLARYSLVGTTSIFRNTLQSLEFRHDTNYAASNTANGPTGAAATPGACTAAACTSSGKGDNAITAQFDYFF